jgi:hypothetical protein
MSVNICFRTVDNCVLSKGFGCCVVWAVDMSEPKVKRSKNAPAEMRSDKPVRRCEYYNIGIRLS